MAYLGDFALGSTFDTKFCTVQTTGAPFTLGGTPVISAYLGNDVTQLTAGITLSVDFDGVTGLHNVRVVATSGNGYATATNYQLVITTGTVNSVSVVGYVVAEFSIEARSALRPTTAARTLVVDAAGLADANVVKLGPTAGGTAQTARDLGLAIPAAVAGAAGGLFIAGTNAATTVTTALTTTFTGNLTGSIGSLAAQAKTDVKTQVTDGLAVDTYAEPAQGAPSATTTLAVKMGFLYKFLRNKVTQDATTTKIFNDDAVTVDHKATVSDDGTTYTRGEIATGP